MARYRYRTALLVGRWRRTPREALRDAVHNGFAQWKGPPWTEVAWFFPGEIEEDDGPAAQSGSGSS